MKHNKGYRTLKTVQSYGINKDTAHSVTCNAEKQGNGRISHNELQPLALQVCSAIGCQNVDDMAAVLAAMPETERRRILDMAATLTALKGNGGNYEIRI